MATFTTTLPQALEPFITEWFFNRLNMIPPRFPNFMNVMGSGRGFEEHVRSAGVGSFVLKPEGTPVSFDDPVQGARVRTVHSTYALGIRVTMEMMEDDQHGIIRQLPEDLADSARDHRDTLGHGILNDAFTGGTYLGLDGLALCTTHTNLKTGTAQTNELNPPVQLSVAGMQSALTNMRTTTNESDRYITLTPSMLVIHTSELFTAAELLDSQQAPYTADNQINSVSSNRIGVREFATEYMDDDDRWFLMASKTQHTMTWWNRKSVNLKRSGDSMTYDALWDSHYRASVAFYDWRGWVGSNP